jgi:hypothetical protein
LGSSLQNNGPVGGPRQSGNNPAATEVTLSLKWASIFLITAGSSIQAMILTSSSHLLQVSTSMANTRFKRLAQVIARDGMYAGFAGAKTGH